MLEKTRMAVFSILTQEFAKGHSVIDAFAGSGVLGFEALSRGAAHCIFFDTLREHVTAIEELADTFKCRERVRTICADVMRHIGPDTLFAMPGNKPARLIFLDPPHAMSNDPTDRFWTWFESLSACHKVVDANTVVVLGHHSYADTPEASGGWRRFDRREYGQVGVSLYDLGASSADTDASEADASETYDDLDA